MGVRHGKKFPKRFSCKEYFKYFYPPNKLSTVVEQLEKVNPEKIKL
jgi:hypothetical protein